MATDAQIPTPDELVGKGIDKLVDLRPRALAHINEGRGYYAAVIAGWRAQAALMCRRLADYAANGRVPFAAGAPLLEFVGSEFPGLGTLSPRPAYGQVVLTRAGGRPGGPIRKGARFSRPEDPTARRLWKASQFEVLVDTAVRQGDTTVTVPIVATRDGVAANRPLVGDLATELVISDDIHDRTAWTVQSYEAAGGADAVTDRDIQQFVAAFANGQYGPNDRAAIAGAFGAGAKHAIAVDDPAAAALQLLLADASWASSDLWTKRVRQGLTDANQVGFGCKVICGQVTNQLVIVEAVMRVRDPASLADTTPLDAALQKALRAYFDDRSDFDRWSLGALRGIAARADRRFRSCVSIAVKTLSGTVVPEPTSSTGTHFMLLDNAVHAEFLPPN